MASLAECQCEVPVPYPAPQKAHACVKCGLWINPEWTSNDQTTGRFYDRLARALPAGPDDDFFVFRAQAEARERAGRKRFLHRHLGRDNLHDGTEENADGANYVLFDHLQAVRREGRDDDLGLALVAANYDFLAHRAKRQLWQKRRGKP